MTNSSRIRPCPTSSEEGYILVAVIFMLAILIISLAAAAPSIKKEIQRDRELETMHRGKQYIRAIQLYYRKFHAYPPNVDALVKTNEIRYLRKKYIDPTTGKEEWKIIRFGQAKTQTLGFFGQPIAGAGSAGGSVLAGIGPAGGNGLTGSSGIGGGFNSSAGGSSIFGSANSSAGAAPATNSTSGSTDQSGGNGAAGSSGSTGTGTAGAASGTAAAGSTDSSSSTGSGTATGLSGQSFGGAGIIGFSPNSLNLSLLVYKKKNHYNEWEFIYDPLLEQMMQGGNTGAVGQPASSTSSPIGSPSGIGGGIGTGSGSGNSPVGINPGGGSGSNPSPAPPSPPQ